MFSQKTTNYRVDKDIMLKMDASKKNFDMFEKNKHLAKILSNSTKNRYPG